MPILFALAAAAASPAALPPADSADSRCLVLLGYLGAHGGPEQATASQAMIPYFVGKLIGRNPSAAVGTLMARSADEAKAQAINARAEGARCQADYRAGIGSLQGLRAAVSASAIPHMP